MRLTYQQRSVAQRFQLFVRLSGVAVEKILVHLGWSRTLRILCTIYDQLLNSRGYSVITQLFRLSICFFLSAFKFNEPYSHRNLILVLTNLFINCRHEVPIAADPISIIHMDEDIVVVNKPASIPVSGIEDCQCICCS